MCVCVPSCSSRLRLFVTLWTLALQAPLSMGFSRQEYWSGLPCFPPGHLPDPGIEPASPVSLALQVDSLPLSQLGSLLIYYFSHFPREVTEAQKGGVTSSTSRADEQWSRGGPQAAGSRLCACDCYNSSYVLSCPVFQALESRLPVHGNLTTALSIDEKTEAWRCEVCRPERSTQEVVEPVSSSLQAEPVFLSKALCLQLPIQGSPTHTRAGARQTKEVAKEEVAESGGVWGKPECQSPV